MLDKSVPYADVSMRRPKGRAIPPFELPDGFSFVLYSPGDEQAWAKIETSVLEFSEEQSAVAYFQKEYLADPKEVRRRCLFIENEKGEKVATSSAWWEKKGGKRYPLVHWVAVMPNYQDMGLGKAIVGKTMQMLLEIEGDQDFYLHTQTWSHKAIRIYEKAGFDIAKESPIKSYTTEEYDKAMTILSSIATKKEETK